jgi:RNA polymerase sigma-70 factor (ECF subfamily)
MELTAAASDLWTPPEDWRTCFRRLGPKLLLFARQWLPSLSDAEDAVQDAFVRFWSKHRDKPVSNQGLLFAAVRSAALDQLRREKRRRNREQSALAQDVVISGEKLFEPAAGEDEQRLLEAAIGALPIEQREVLTLKIWGELTFAEIAEALSIPANTAASRYRYALSALRKSMQPSLQP